MRTYTDTCTHVYGTYTEFLQFVLNQAAIRGEFEEVGETSDGRTIVKFGSLGADERLCVFYGGEDKQR